MISDVLFDFVSSSGLTGLLFAAWLQLVRPAGVDSLFRRSKGKDSADSTNDYNMPSAPLNRLAPVQ